MSNLKAIKRTLIKPIKTPEFWFTIIFYPLLLYGYDYANKNLNRLPIHKYQDVYFIVTFLVFLYIILSVTYEVIEKTMKHKRAGDKLKIKKQQKDWM